MSKYVKMKTGKILIIVLCLMMTMSTTVFADNVSQIIGDHNTVIFSDVPSTHWASEQIYSFVNQGIVSGYGNGIFAPGNAVSREEFCKLLVSTFNGAMEMPSEVSFSDVPASRWSAPYIEVCKDFLTGYANPFGGLPAFHPAEDATREDIAVALVRMMGYTEQDASDQNYALYAFYDGYNVSPNLLPYVSIACEKGLINGYPDGTFGAAKGITRAETVVLLNRATKQAVTDINAELDIKADVIYSTDGKTATINIETEIGTSVTVNNEAVIMSNNGYDQYEGNYIYSFTEEGEKTFTVIGTKGGKTKRIDVPVKYELAAPVLTISNCPTHSDTESVTINGTVEDANDYYPLLTVNGKSVSVDFSGYWSIGVTLTEGSNDFTFIASNKLGKTTTDNRTIEFGVGAPTLRITNCPTNSETTWVRISGTVKDTNDSYPALMVNGKSVSVDFSGYWSTEVSLSEGSNEFTFTATNDLGKSTTEKRTIEFGVGAPTLKITNCPTNSETTYVRISGTVKDTNDNYPSLTVNGKSVSVDFSGYWSTEVSLSEGSNEFTFTATNDLGKSTIEKRTVEFEVSAPTLKISNCPTSSDTASARINGTVKDINDSYPTLSINGKSISVDFSGYWSFEVVLSEGSNEFTFVASNDLGKSITEQRTIVYEI